MVSTPDFKATSIHQLSKTSIPFAYLSNTVTNLCMHLLNSISPLHHVGITWDCVTCRLSSMRSCSAKWSEVSGDSLCLCEKFGRVTRQWTLYSILVKSPEPQVVISTYRFRRHDGKSWSLISRARSWLNLLN